MNAMQIKELACKASADGHFYIENAQPRRAPFFCFFKRLFDIFFSLFLGILLLPVMLIIALLVKIDMSGPVIYKQERLGKNGKRFYIFKFRTMDITAEDDGPRWAKADDPRCTKIGRKLRKTRLDELPQLWNILKGEMSFVGPRPERPYFYDQFETYIHGFSNRMAVAPGLTGLAQVMGGYDLLPEKKILYDMEYIKHRSLLLDLKIIFKTVKLVFTHKGAR